ncbi:YggT family protein [Arsenicicoccus dermatophilus]|uniref:YggT family protein n=1 Tax=Arsenicicoccus dermatophilus TaxID=1076331 RepID=UPI001F4CE27C|nr:YggT family protein [Arsenicicoccus dermatophilus]MCH8613229.1 YggT family protein [Arsenicicoccus dermatophilus]
MPAVKTLILDILWVFWVLLLARMVLGYVVMLARDWRPTGVILLVAEGICTVTDPPLRALRKVIKPLRIGGIALDLAFLVLLLVVVALMQAVARV